MDYFTYITLGILPSIIWLFYYLRKDLHPEPKKLIIQVFILGMLITPSSITLEKAYLWIFQKIDHITAYSFGIILFLIGISFIEEFLKYLAVKLRMSKDPEFNEPTDAMIYLIVSALGFAALENILYLMNAPIISALMLTIFRFLSAVFLHTLSSALLGYFLARYWFFKEKGMIFIGFLISTFFHTVYNIIVINFANFTLLPIIYKYPIINNKERILYLLLLFIVMTSLVSLCFRNLRKNSKINF